jgi:hypothetical protein
VTTIPGLPYGRSKNLNQYIEYTIVGGDVDQNSNLEVLNVIVGIITLVNKAGDI